MAKLDYQGFADTQAPTTVPDDLQHIQASPRAFGEPLAEGLENLGAGIVKSAKFYGQVAADNATNNTLQQVTNVLYGDPNATHFGPDGQPTGDTGYFGMRGADAMRARQETAQRIDEIIKQNSEGLDTPLARYQYDTDTRRYRAQWLSKIGEHADTQQKTWALGTNTTTATLALNEASRAPMDDNIATEAQEKVRKAYVRNAQINGMDAGGAVLKADQDVALARIRSLSVSDPRKAQDLLDKSSDVLGSLPNYDSIVRGVKQSVVNATLAPAINTTIARVKAEAQGSTSADAEAAGTPTPGQVKLALLGQESRNRDNAPTSINGAIGPGQIEPATFARFAKPGEVITNANDNRAVSGRYVDYLSGLPNVQGDPARIAVGYFSGEKNIAPLGSATPYIRDTEDGNHKKTSAYVADVEKRLGENRRYPSVADYYSANEGKIVDQAQADAPGLFPDNPDAQERYVQGVQRHLSQTIAQQHQQYEVDVHTVEQAFTSSHPPISEEQLTAMGPEMANAWTRMQIDSPFQAAAIQRRFDAAAKGQAKTYGTQFNSLLTRVLAPVGDPQRITNAAQLWPYVAPGENGALTNTGANELSGILSRRQGSKGEADTALLRTFLTNAHKLINPIQNEKLGIFYPKGEQQFQKFVAQAFPQIEAEQKAGHPLAEILKEGGNVYNSAISFSMSQEQVMQARLNGVRYDPHMAGQRTMDANMKAAKTPQDLEAMRAAGKITREQRDQMAIQRGWARAPEAPGPSVPLPQ